MEFKTQKSEETRNRIIASARKLFHEKGFEAVAVREIVEGAGCAKGTFYLYFETKMDLLNCIADMVFRGIFDIVDAELSTADEDPFRQIDNIFEALQIYMQKQEGSLKLLHTHEMLELSLENNISGAMIDALIERIAEFIRCAVEKGHFRPVDAGLYARMLFSMGHDMLESAMLFRFPADIGEVKEELRIIMRKILEK